jgi:hypothetical protein
VPVGSTVTSVRVAGALLVERGLVTPAQLAEALEHQRAHGGDLDEILPRLFKVARSEIAEALADRDGARRIDIGSILFATGVVDEKRLHEARERSVATGQPLGPILVEMGAITRLDLASALADQWADSPAEILPSPAARDQRGGSRQADAEEVRSAMAALHASIRAAGDSIDPAVLEELHQREAALASRVGALEHAMAQPIEADPALVAEIHGIGESLVALRGSLADVASVDDVVALQASIADLDELRSRLAETASRADGAAPLDAVEGLLADLAVLGTSVEELAGRSSQLTALSETVAELAARPLGDLTLSTKLDELREQVAGVITKVDGAAPIAELRLLLGDITDLSSRLDLLEGAAKEVAGLRETVAELAERPAGDPGLAERLDELALRLEGVAVVADAASGGDGLHEAVAALSARIDESAGVSESVATLSAAVDGLRETDGVVRELVDAVDTLRSELAELGERPLSHAALAERVDDLARGFEGALAALDTRLGEAVANTEQLAPLAHQVADAADRLAALEGVGADLAMLRDDVAELRARPEPDTGLAERLETLAQRVEVLSLDALGPAAEAAVETVAERVAALAGAHESATARIDELGERLSGLRAELAAFGEHAPAGEGLEALEGFVAELAERVAGTAPASGLAALVLAVEELQSLLTPHERRLDDLERRVGAAEERADAARQASEEALGAMHARLDELAAATSARFDAVLGKLDTGQPGTAPVDPDLRSEVTTLATALDAVRASFAASLERLERSWDEERASLRALASQADGGPAPAAAATSGAPSTSATPDLVALERQLERVSDRVVEQERSLVEHFARRERALIERLGAGTDVGQRLAELTRGLEELRIRVERATAGASEGGGPSGEELTALKEAMFTRIEKLASSIDWRFQRLEGGPGTAAGAADLQTRVNELARAVEELSGREGHAPRTATTANGVYLALVPLPGGHQLLELAGETPAAGARLSVPDGDGEFVVVAVGDSPLPGDERNCVFVEPADVRTPA